MKKELIFRAYGLVHLTIKRIVGKPTLSSAPNKLPKLLKSYGKITDSEYVNLWLEFINNSTISDHSHLHYAGFTLETNEWVHPEWIWTNAAIVRCYASINRFQEAIKLANDLLNLQTEEGGWVVRNDYDKKGPKPIIAPNDSAYIANNALITAYNLSKEKKFLDSAIKCADWIIRTAREDGLVYSGYNNRDKKWEKDHIIVDTGFTAALFAQLYKITKEDKYLRFLERFVNRYIELFYSSKTKLFSTSIDKSNLRQGGEFGRGQAWALEGLIAAYDVLNDASIKLIIEDNIYKIISLQNRNGGWSYNFSHPLMGQDCKGVSIIGKIIAIWGRKANNVKMIYSAQAALNWVKEHTLLSGDGKGGIFSYSLEGAIVKDLYSSCAFVYGCAYSIELSNVLKNDF